MIKLSSGPAPLTINHGGTFMVTDPAGQIAHNRPEGLFADDTRFLSEYKITVDDQPWEWVSSAAISYDASRIYLRGPALEHNELTGTTKVNKGDLILTLVRLADRGVHETLEITNYALQPVRALLQLDLASDFASLFEVKLHAPKRRARIVTTWSQEQATLSSRYQREDFARGFDYQIVGCTPAPTYANGRLTFEIELEPRETWQMCGHMILLSDGIRREAPCVIDQPQAGQHSRSLKGKWLEQCSRVITPNDHLQTAYDQALDDLAALRLYEADLDDAWMPAAGIPWFVAVFGRDSLIAAIQASIVEPRLAEGALRRLGQLQAHTRDDQHDAQPGKIPHELRVDELAHFGLIPQVPYYGTWDATPLWLISLWQTWRWTGNRALVEGLLPVAEGCLTWIDHDGDSDGDGFQEYQTYSPLGYANMGWKDAHDAVVYPDGSQVDQPKATCELQAYVYAAKRGMAELYRSLGQADRAVQLEEEAATLKRRFNEAFWLPAEGIYAFGLDRDKRPIATVASNAGHCLWAGIADDDKAAKVVQRLLREDMWTGWGIRTLSSANPAFNPVSYQLGSVWPHDTSMIAVGMARYGFRTEAAQLVEGLLRAASFFPNYRLPELFAGYGREPAMFPVHYPEANVPQAWAAGSIFDCVQTLAGLEAHATEGLLLVRPWLTDVVPELELQGLAIGDSRVTVRLRRSGAGVEVGVSHLSGPEITVRQEPASHA